MINTTTEAIRVVIQRLATVWIKADLPAMHLTTYADHVASLVWLQNATDNLERTTLIFRRVLEQAIRGGHSSEWVAAESQFESSAQSRRDRKRRMLLALEYEATGDDPSLDLYNEGLKRFK